MHDTASYLPQLLAAYIGYVLAVLSPGPAVFAIIGTSMTHGRKAGLTIALGIFAGSFTWACAATLGLAALLQTYAIALEILKIMGGLYLLYLAIKAFRAARQKDELPTVLATGRTLTTKALFLRGYAIHITNPKAIFAWLALITLGTPKDAPASVMLVFVGGCMLLGLSAFIGYALVFSTGGAVRIYKNLRRWIEGTMAAFYALAGIRLLTSRI